MGATYVSNRRHDEVSTHEARSKRPSQSSSFEATTGNFASLCESAHRTQAYAIELLRGGAIQRETTRALSATRIAAARVAAQRTTLSVVIPAHNEAANVERTLRAAADRATGRVEILVVDAGSTDGTLDVARRYVDSRGDDETRVRFVLLRAKASARGRGPVLNEGLAASSGELVLFLHADTLPPPAYDELLRGALADASCQLCAFSFGLAAAPDEPKPHVARVLEIATNLRSRFLELPWGDQGLAARRETLERLGGFAPIPILEDVELVLRARRRGARSGERIVTLEAVAETSSRRYDHLGAVRSNFLDTIVMLFWHLGATPSQCFRLYYGRHVV